MNRKAGALRLGRRRRLERVESERNGCIQLRIAPFSDELRVLLHDMISGRCGARTRRPSHRV